MRLANAGARVLCLGGGIVTEKFLYSAGRTTADVLPSYVMKTSESVLTPPVTNIDANV